MGLSDYAQFSLTGLPDWQLELIRKYPLIYTERDEFNIRFYGKPSNKHFEEKDYCNLCFGFEFNQGWVKLVDEFSRVATDLVVHLRATVRPDAYIHASIFKEKFGELVGKDAIIWQARSKSCSMPVSVAPSGSPRTFAKTPEQQGD